MIVSDRSLVKNSRRSTYPDIKCLYGNISHDMRIHMYGVSQYAQMLFEAAKEQGVWDASLSEDIHTMYTLQVKKSVFCFFLREL